MPENNKDYLIECFISARSEAELILKNQDNVLKLQLVIQAVMWALTKRIKLFSIESNEVLPEALILAVPLSFTFFCLYFSQDSLLHYLSKYLGNLSYIEAKINNRDLVIPNWNASKELKEFMSNTPLLFRFFVLSLAFLIIPNYLLLDYIKTSYSKMDIVEYLFCAGQLLLSIFMIFHLQKAYNRRRNDVWEEKQESISTELESSI